MTFATVCLVCGLTCFADITDSQSLLATIESKQSVIKDVQFEFEGSLSFNDFDSRKNLNLSDSGVYDTFSGTYAWRSDGHELLETYHRLYPDKVLKRERIAVFKDKSEMLLISEDQSGGRGQIGSSLVQNTERQGSPGQFFLLNNLKRKLSDPDLVIENQGVANIDGYDCVLIVIRRKANNRVDQKYWFDMKHGGFARRRELYMANAENRVASSASVQLGMFEKNGTQFWIPIAGRIDGFLKAIDGKVIIAEKPTNVEHVYIIRASVRLNESPSLSRFSVNFKPGMPITDTLRKLSYEHKQQILESRMPTHAEVEALLKNQLEEIERQGNEVSASSSATQQIQFGSTIVLIAILCVVSVLSVLVIMSRR